MWLATLVDEGVLREWIVNIGARNAKERIAHLMCELLARVKAVGLATSDSFELPITKPARRDHGVKSGAREPDPEGAPR